VNHAWGAESRLSHDHLLQLDNLLAAFFRDLDRRIGADAYVAVLTADHGFMPVPEHLRSLGHDAGRIAPVPLLARLEAGLAGRFGEGPWVRGWSAQGVLLNRNLAAQKRVDPDALEEAAAGMLRGEEGVAAAFTRRQASTGTGSDSPLLAAVRKGWHRERSADVQVLPKPGWMVSSYPSGTTHGSPHPYDTHVPILFYGPKWVRPGRVDSRVEVVDIAPTLAALLGIPAPSSSEGRLLPLAP